MPPLPLEPTREQVLTYIFEASNYGNLGLFIGAGFSKAVLNSGGVEIALSWGELLARAADTLGVDIKKVIREGLGYPEIASRLCVVLIDITDAIADDECC